MINTASGALDGAVSIPVGRVPSGMAVSPDGSVLYVVNSWDDTVSVIDTTSRTVIDTVQFDVNPGQVGLLPQIAMNAEGTRLVISDVAGGTVATIILGDGQNVPPVASAIVSDVIDSTNGAVTVTVTASDGDNDPLNISTTTPGDGAVDIHANGDGTYTLDPTSRAKKHVIRRSAAATPSTMPSSSSSVTEHVSSSCRSACRSIRRIRITHQW